jgi:NAD(P)-dependent dehydrogenase (short-subunit alcohol dehydrogenase family)
MNDRVAVITGASSGIGRATARLFAARGCHVVALGRDRAELAALVEEARTLPGEVVTEAGDLRDAGEAAELVAKAAGHFDRIDSLVNAAGILRSGSIRDTTLEDWDEMMDINVRSVFRLSQLCLPYLEAVKGSIVNVSSVAGPRAFPNVLAYCVSKAALDQLTRCMALEVGSSGVRVNAINPGVVVTNLHRRGGMAPDAYDRFLENAKNTHPLGRPGSADEVAELIWFLASESAGWITGATYAIDGGRGQTCAR